MVNNDKLMEQAFKSLEKNTLPTKSQKKTMLNNILSDSAKEEHTPFEKVRQMISIYPWRFAFAASGIWTIACTLIFGSRYTNIFLRLIGG